MSKDKVTPRILTLAGVAILVLIALIGWFAFVSPQRSKANDLNQEIATAQTNLAAAKAMPLPKPKKKDKGAQSPAQALALALPTDLQMPSLLRQVQRLAAESNVSLDSFAPSTPVQGSGYQAVPIDVSITGRYAQIRRFLRQLRMQAGITNGRVKASGRLLGVETLGLAAGGTGLPQLSATLRLDAFVFEPAALTPGTDTTTTTTTTTTSTAGTAVGATP